MEPLLPNKSSIFSGLGGTMCYFLMDREKKHSEKNYYYKIKGECSKNFT